MRHAGIAIDAARFASREKAKSGTYACRGIRNERPFFFSSARHRVSRPSAKQSARVPRKMSASSAVPGCLKNQPPPWPCGRPKFSSASAANTRFYGKLILSPGSFQLETNSKATTRRVHFWPGTIPKTITRPSCK